MRMDSSSARCVRYNGKPTPTLKSSSSTPRPTIRRRSLCAAPPPTKESASFGWIVTAASASRAIPATMPRAANGSPSSTPTTPGSPTGIRDPRRAMHGNGSHRLDVVAALQIQRPGQRLQPRLAQARVLHRFPAQERRALQPEISLRTGFLVLRRIIAAGRACRHPVDAGLHLYVPRRRGFRPALHLAAQPHRPRPADRGDDRPGRPLRRAVFGGGTRRIGAPDGQVPPASDLQGNLEPAGQSAIWRGLARAGSGLRPVHARLRLLPRGQVFPVQDASGRAQAPSDPMTAAPPQQTPRRRVDCVVFLMRFPAEKGAAYGLVAASLWPGRYGDGKSVNNL